VRVHLDAERPQKRLGDRAPGDAGRRLPGAGALEDVADVGQPILLSPDEVGVAGAREMDLLALGFDRPRVHPLFPVCVVAVDDTQRDRAAERAAVTDAARHLRLVALDLHPPTTAVPELAPGEVAVECLTVELEPGRQALDDGRQPRPVGLTGGDEMQRHGRCRLVRVGRGRCFVRPATEPGRSSGT
jgi:hypothetical protein